MTKTRDVCVCVCVCVCVYKLEYTEPMENFWDSPRLTSEDFKLVPPKVLIFPFLVWVLAGRWPGGRDGGREEYYDQKNI